jgi:hypothetical protein
MRKLHFLVLIPLGLLIAGLAPPSPPYPLPAVPVYSTTVSPTPTTSPEVAGSSAPQQGQTVPWNGAYFNNRILEGDPVGQREDGCVDFNWGATSPWPGIVGSDNFSVRWTKNQYFEPGLYRFHLVTDDGARFWIDPQVNNYTIIDAWKNQPPTEYTSQIQLQGGTNSLKLEYYDNTGGAEIRFWWEKLGDYPNWKAEYYKFFGEPRLCGGPVLTRNELAINHDWGTGTPSTVLGTDFWAARWTGRPRFVGGLTRFFTLSDDGVRLWVDANDNGSFDDPGEFIIDRWVDQSRTLRSGDVYMSPGFHRVKLEYFERVGDAIVLLWWRTW